VHMLGTGLTGDGNRSDRCELKLLQLPCFQVVCMHSSRGSCIGSGGACMCAGGGLCGFSSFISVVCALCLSFVCLGCVEPLPLPKGSETCLLQVILLSAFVWLSIACWSFILFVSFLFLFSLVTFVWVLSMHSSMGRLRTKCGLRTGGWSLPCVMSD
jgi:hypothetical protein